MTTYITIAVKSGGEGKTRTAVDLSHRLAQDGSKTLLVGFDSQGNDSTYLGFDPEPAVFNFLLADIPVANCLRATSRRNLWLMPGNHKNLIIDRSDIMRDDIVAQFKDNLSSLFDYIIFDTPPAGLLQESALAAADIIVIPSKAECKGLDAINQTLMAINRLHAGKEKQPYTMLVNTMYDRRISEHRTNADLIQANFPTIYTGVIPYRAKMIECASYGKTIWEHDPNCDACHVYNALIDIITAKAGSNE